MSTETSLQPATLRSFRALFGETVRLYRTHFFALMGFAGWLALPLAVTVVLRVTFGDVLAIDTALLVVSGVSVAIATWSYCHIARFAAYVHEHGKPYDQLPDVGRALLPVFLTFLVYGIVVLIGASLVIPALLFAVWFAFAPLAVALHGRGVFAGLSESRELVRGRFFRIAGRLWSMDALFVLAYIAVVIAIDLTLGYDVAHLDITAPLPVPMDILLCIFEILAVPFIIVYRTLLYLSAKNG